MGAREDWQGATWQGTGCSGPTEGDSQGGGEAWLGWRTWTQSVLGPRGEDVHPDSTKSERFSMRGISSSSIISSSSQDDDRSEGRMSSRPPGVRDDSTQEPGSVVSASETGHADSDQSKCRSTQEAYSRVVELSKRVRGETEELRGAVERVFEGVFELISAVVLPSERENSLKNEALSSAWLACAAARGEPVNVDTFQDERERDTRDA